MAGWRGQGGWRSIYMVFHNICAEWGSFLWNWTTLGFEDLYSQNGNTQALKLALNMNMRYAYMQTNSPWQTLEKVGPPISLQRIHSMLCRRLSAQASRPTSNLTFPSIWNKSNSELRSRQKCSISVHSHKSRDLTKIEMDRSPDLKRQGKPGTSVYLTFQLFLLLNSGSLCNIGLCVLVVYNGDIWRRIKLFPAVKIHWICWCWWVDSV